MSLYQTLKPFWPILLTLVLPRALGYFNALKTAVRTRPPPRPLSTKASRSLNILFVAICFFLWLSFSPSSSKGLSNVFATTNTRFQVPIDVLFSRLASLRRNGLTPEDEALKAKITSASMRQLYLRYGPSTITTCPFCHPDDPLTYALHHLPTHILAPHLLNLLIIGLATSRSIAGITPSHFRAKAVLASIALLALDIYATTTSNPYTFDPNMPSPPSTYVTSTTLRPLALTLLNTTLAFLIYATATSRFIFFPFLASASAASDSDPAELAQQTNKLLSDTNLALQMTQMKLRALNVTRNAIVRDDVLKAAEDGYWDSVRGMEREGGWTEQGLEGVFEDEEVQGAMARAYGGGNVDVARMRRDAEGFVREVTRGLDAS